MLLRLYSYHKDADAQSKGAPLKLPDEEGHPTRGGANGHPRAPHATERQARDVQEFELEGLMSDDGDDEAESSSDGAMRKHPLRDR